jgi:hypothetical protein
MRSYGDSDGPPAAIAVVALITLSGRHDPVDSSHQKLPQRPVLSSGNGKRYVSRINTIAFSF